MAQELALHGKKSPEMKGILSALKKPLFNGQRVDKYSAIIQGHVHWKIYEESSSTRYYAIRAVGMAYDLDPVNTASYVILKEKVSGGYDFEEVLVTYDREKMLQAMLNSDSPDHSIEKFTSFRR